MSRKGGHNREYSRKVQYKKADTFDEKVIDKAGEKSSQRKSSTYERLKEKGLLDTFLKLLSTAAAKGYSKNGAVEYINGFMGEYFRAGGKGLCLNTLQEMLERYPDVQEAWTVNRDTITGLAIHRLNTLLYESNSIDELLKVIKSFDDSGMAHSSNASNYIPTRKTILVNDTELSRATECDEEHQVVSTQTIETLRKLMDNIDEIRGEIEV